MIGSAAPPVGSRVAVLEWGAPSPRRQIELGLEWLFSQINFVVMKLDLCLFLQWEGQTAAGPLKGVEPKWTQI